MRLIDQQLAQPGYPNPSLFRTSRHSSSVVAGSPAITSPRHLAQAATICVERGVRGVKITPNTSPQRLQTSAVGIPLDTSAFSPTRSPAKKRGAWGLRQTVQCQRRAQSHPCHRHGGCSWRTDAGPPPERTHPVTATPPAPLLHSRCLLLLLFPTSTLPCHCSQLSWSARRLGAQGEAR